MPTVFLNGQFLDASQAQLSAFDAGTQHGVGLFETMLAGVDPDGDDLVVLDLEAHADRIGQSAQTLGLSSSVWTQGLSDAVFETVRRSGVVKPGARARVRLTMTGGALNLLHPGATRHDPTILIHVQPATVYPAAMFDDGVTVTLADWKANPLDQFQGHKTLNYWPRLRELQIAASKQAAEALVFQVTNHLSGGCVSNAILVKNDQIISPIARGEEAPAASEGQRAPAIPSPILPGTVRSWVFDRVREDGRTVVQRMVTISDVLDADELFLTNSSWGVLPVTRVESKAVGTGTVGVVASRLCQQWRARLA